jgi:alkanesulfonate monooxygenase SsuD/methylene tetrahydromethanopterin reductase-like flavin-dependent oxidoreductase (luciferase family)
VEEARAHEYDAEQQALRAAGRGRVLVGGVERVRAGLRSHVTAAQADEVMVLTHVHSHEARKRSYELVAQALSGA